MVCIDIDITVHNTTKDKDGDICYTGTEIYDAMYTVTSPGDFEALLALDKLEEYAALYKEFLYARGKTLEEALKNLEEKTGYWNRLKDGQCIISEEQEKILFGFVKFKP